tara:strand:- start:8014 stop:9504 length:1491 start_codon:yes stop_codon:yes gene_type:complete
MSSKTLSLVVEKCYKTGTKKLRGRLIAPYQRDGVLWMLWRERHYTGPKGGFLCDEMGLGKTVQTITTMLGNPQKSTLIVTPKSIITQWKTEIDRFAPNMKVMLFDGPNRKTNFDDFDVVIAPYSLVYKKKGEPDETPLHSVHWNRIILDEAHEIRNIKSKMNISLSSMKSDIRWLLTGTPIFNTIKDFIGLCRFLGVPRQSVQGDLTNVRKKYVLRRTKEDLAKFNKRLELPPCDFENVEVKMLPEEWKLYEAVFMENQDIVRDLFRNSTNIGMHSMHILECLLRSRQTAIHPQIYLNGVAKKKDEVAENWEHETKKIDTLLSMVKEHPNENTLVFSQFIGEMNLIMDELHDSGIKTFRIDGSVSKEDRDRQVSMFKSGPRGSVFLIQIKAGGQGLNLQEATRVYITAPSWNPATELQAIGRSHRTGQTKRVVVRKFIATGPDGAPTIEHSMMELQQAKSVVCSEVLNDPRLAKQIPTRSGGGNLSIRDIKKIFQV